MARPDHQNLPRYWMDTAAISLLDSLLYNINYLLRLRTICYLRDPKLAPGNKRAPRFLLSSRKRFSFWLFSRKLQSNFHSYLPSLPAV